MSSRPLSIGTRGSPLARAQAAEVCRLLIEAEPALGAPDALDTVIIRTSGDAIQDRTLADIGGKGLFTKEIDEAMLAGRIDLAVHSVKDLPTWLPPGIILGAVLPRADARDVLISPGCHALADLPPAAVVGTASLRRQAQVLARRPDLRVVPLRGNVGTRLGKIEQGQVAATLLALAGLQRLGLTDVGGVVLSTEEMLPAAGQGAIGITCREDDEDARALLDSLHDQACGVEIAAERAMLAILDGSCRTPIGGLGRFDGDRLRLNGLVARPDGSRVIAGERSMVTPGAAEAAGRDLGLELKARAGSGFFDGP
jgi:hydroxymethylbilane synthase